MPTCSNLPTKPQATLFLLTKKPGMCQSCCFKVGCHPLFFNRIDVKPLKLCSKSRRSNRHIPQKINKFASLVLAERYPYFNGVIGLHIWRDLIYSEMSVLLELPAFTSRSFSQDVYGNRVVRDFGSRKVWKVWKMRRKVY